MEFNGTLNGVNGNERSEQERLMPRMREYGNHVFLVSILVDTKQLATSQADNQIGS